MRLGRDLIVCSCFVVSLLSFTCTVHGLSGSPLEPPGSSRTLALGRHHQWPSMLNFLSCQVHGRLIPSAGNKAVCHHTLLRSHFCDCLPFHCLHPCFCVWILICVHHSSCLLYSISTWHYLLGLYIKRNLRWWSKYVPFFFLPELVLKCCPLLWI